MAASEDDVAGVGAPEGDAPQEDAWIGLLASCARDYGTWAGLAERLPRTGGVELMPEDGAHLRPVKTVAQFYWRMSNGGIERVMASLAERFQTLGYRSVVITQQPVDESCYDVPEGVEFATLPGLDGARWEDSACERYRALGEIVRRYRIDALWYHAWLSESVFLDRAACAHLGVRFVLATHGAFTFPFGDEPARPSFYVLPYVVRTCDAVTAENTANRDYYRRFAANVFELPNPTPPELVRHAASTAPRKENGFGSHRMVWVGRFDPYKRQEDAIRVLAKVRQRVPDATLTFVGKSEDGSFERGMVSLARELGVEGAVEMAGFKKDPWPYYQSSDLLLSTTTTEGFCMVLLEASAAALPVAMYRLPYLPFDKSAGVKSVPMRDIDALADAAADMLLDPAWLAYMARGSQECFRRIDGFDLGGALKRVFASEAPAAPEPFDPVGAMLLEHLRRGDESMRAQRDRRIADESARWQQRLEDEHRAADERCRQVEHDFRASNSFRVGRVITWLPRKILRRA